jgi:hypothetical protein
MMWIRRNFIAATFIAGASPEDFVAGGGSGRGTQVP